MLATGSSGAAVAVIAALPDISREQGHIAASGIKPLNLQDNMLGPNQEPRFAATVHSNSGTQSLKTTFNPSQVKSGVASGQNTRTSESSIRNLASLQGSHHTLGKANKFVNKSGNGRGTSLRKQSTQTPVPVYAVSRP